MRTLHTYFSQYKLRIQMLSAQPGLRHEMFGTDQSYHSPSIRHYGFHLNILHGLRKCKKDVTCCTKTGRSHHAVRAPQTQYQSLSSTHLPMGSHGSPPQPSITWICDSVKLGSAKPDTDTAVSTESGTQRRGLLGLEHAEAPSHLVANQLRNAGTAVVERMRQRTSPMVCQ